MGKYIWKRYAENGYEVSSQGDRNFSALYALMPDGRTIEMWYQCDIKGYDIGGTKWKNGKGKSSLIEYPDDQQWEMYLSLWKLWAIHNLSTMKDLRYKLNGKTIFTDRFATSPINQARAMAWLFNNWFTV